ncbi:MAG: cation diffusion facilitator family transporter [bacterium]|nr:cation diffusion facilitator family transporter [bacterium]
MKIEKNILVAFVLNLTFSVLELIGGFFTNSIAIMSDALHDFGDALSIGIAFFLERKSQKKPDTRYTYGYARYSILGALITTVILITGSILVILAALQRLSKPVAVNYQGMIVLAIFGVIVNFGAAYATSKGDSLNQKSVNLHMLEDVLGWVVVLAGSILMHFTDITMIDPLMSIGVSIYILIGAVKNLLSVMDVFLEKTPAGLSVAEINEHLSSLADVVNVHHLHLWTLNGESNYATVHVKVKTIKKQDQLKQIIRQELRQWKIVHATIEIEGENDECSEQECSVVLSEIEHHHHH